MKRIIILTLFFIFLLSSVFSNEWDRNLKTGSSDFLVVFDLSDTTNTGDLYYSFGFSKTPISNGSVTEYEGNKLELTRSSFEYNGENSKMVLKASVYAYWHLVLGSNHNLYLKVKPESGAEVSVSYLSYSNDNASSDEDKVNVTGIGGEKTLSEKPLATFSSSYGRFMGSTQINIETLVSTYSFPNDCVCTLTLVLEAK